MKNMLIYLTVIFRKLLGENWHIISLQLSYLISFGLNKNK